MSITEEDLTAIAIAISNFLDSSHNAPIFADSGFNPSAHTELYLLVTLLPGVVE